MKVRNGFVSNSSTASFVLVGFDCTGANLEEKFAKDFYDIADDLDASYIYEGEGGAPNGVEYVLGKYLAYIHSDESYCTSEQVDVQELMEQVEEIRRKVGLEDREILFWKGTMMA